jgi:pimeloyl-ACP methyl ester carboxylesterase
MKKPASEYQSLAQQIQAASPQKLWVGIVKFAGNLDNPLQAGGLVDEIFAEVKAQGFAAAAPETTTIAGHSMGGIIAQKYLANKNFAGLVLLSSYLTRSAEGSSLPKATLPVLTLSGELDGQTRMTRIALDAKSALELERSTGYENVARTKPVIVLPKVNHSQFAGPIRMSSDLDAEVDYNTAQRLIAATVADFLVVNTPGTIPVQDSELALERIGAAIQQTRTLIAPYWAAQDRDALWCADAQRNEARDASQTFTLQVTQELFDNDAAFARSKPSVSLTNPTTIALTPGAIFKFAANPMDISTTPEAVQILGCKNKSREAINKLAELPVGTPMSCQEQNARAYEWALAQVSPEVRDRFARRGRQLRFEDDRVMGSGIQWLPAGIDFDNLASERTTTVSSAALVTGQNAPFNLAGMHYCKLLAPTRAMEWILVDGLRD